jgi:nitronate monooxygenase
MAGACPASLAIAIANAGGLGGCGAVMSEPEGIRAWASEVRAKSNGAFQLNLWVAEPPPKRDKAAEAAVRAFLRNWGPEVQAEAGDTTLPDFNAQCEAMLDVGPPVISSIMGLYPPHFVERMKAKGIKWLATATTVREARTAEAAGADAIIAQGMEAGGHRGSFDAASAEAELVGLFALVPAVADAVKIPVIATGGIADARGIAAALMLGASAVQIGTGFLRCPESNIPASHAGAIGQALPEDTVLTRVLTGRLVRAIATDYVRAASAPDAPKPAPYPVQRGLTRAMREDGLKHNDINRMQATAGQSAKMALGLPAGDVVAQLWQGALDLLEREA